MAVFIGYTEEDAKNLDAVVQGLWRPRNTREWPGPICPSLTSLVSSQNLMLQLMKMKA